MAVGVTQPGGAGTTIMFQTDASAPNGLYYTEADFAAAFPADFVDLGTTPKSYRAKVSVQNGDGTLTGTTTWKGTRSTVYFDTGKSYLVSATGLANRFTEWGLLHTSASGEPIGYDGLNVYFGTNPAVSWGNFKLYGCNLYNFNATAAQSRIFLTPGLIPNVSDMVDVTVFTLAGTQAFGQGGASEIARMKRVNTIGLGSGAVNGHIVQFNCPSADDLTLFWPNGDRKFSTGGYVRIGNATFVGPSTADEARSTIATIMLNPKWSQNCVKPSPSGAALEEWCNFGLLVTDVNGTPLEGATVEIWDEFDKRFVVKTATGSLGTIDFMAPQSVAESPPFFLGISSYPDAPFRNALLVSGHNNDGLMHNHDPYALYINRGRALAGYQEHVREFSFAYSLFLTTERQYYPLYLHIVLQPATGSIPLEASSVERIEAIVPVEA